MITPPAVFAPTPADRHYDFVKPFSTELGGVIVRSSRGADARHLFAQ